MVANLLGPARDMHGGTAGACTQARLEAHAGKSFEELKSHTAGVSWSTRLQEKP